MGKKIYVPNIIDNVHLPYSNVTNRFIIELNEKKTSLFVN